MGAGTDVRRGDEGPGRILARATRLVLSGREPDGLCLGTFGFALPHKRYRLLIALRRLHGCSHLVCAMENFGLTSGSLRLMALAKRPIISLPNQGAVEVGAYVVDSLDDICLETLSRLLPLPRFRDGLPHYHQLLQQLSTEVTGVHNTN